ncbi:MAG: hypothetical protein H6707_04050 [Deltaproteobacteria bacterium]|nr:hypothetical protein [Deltaproteobacteria bacterium]
MLTTILRRQDESDTPLIILTASDELSKSVRLLTDSAYEYVREEVTIWCMLPGDLDIELDRSNLRARFSTHRIDELGATPFAVDLQWAEQLAKCEQALVLLCKEECPRNNDDVVEWSELRPLLSDEEAYTLVSLHLKGSPAWLAHQD